MMRVFPRNAGIRIKLITIFIVIKLLPLIVLAGLAWKGVEQLGGELQSQLEKVADEMQTITADVGQLAVDESVVALDRQAQEAIERQTTVAATAVADFLYSIDRDVTYVASFAPGDAVYRRFLNSRKRDLQIHDPWKMSDEGDAWVPAETPTNKAFSVEAVLEDNQRSFHYRPPKSRQNTLSSPLYLEITFIDLQGQEQIKVTTSDLLSPALKNVANKKNTWLKAEQYFSELANLPDDGIYVSDVIGGYVSTPLIGAYTKLQAEQHGIPFKPEEAAYAGKENPVGKRYLGLVRWVKPVLKDGVRIGYVTLALDHTHIMAFTDNLVPTAERFTEISDASSGNYAFIWDFKGRNISHPRDYFIVGYNPQTGEPVAPWLDTETFERWMASKQPIEEFLKDEPTFSGQSLSIKPALAQIARGEVALDCRYLKFAPQCTGWWNLTQHGGSGSFVIFWSGLWKLTTAAAIPYFTGQYAQSPRGFGFVTIGANVDEFHLPATQAQKKIDKIILEEGEKVDAKHSDMQSYILTSLEKITYDLSVSTLVMVLIVVVVGIAMASYLTRRILYLIEGLKRFQQGDLQYRFEMDSNDEMGRLGQSFNTMAQTIAGTVDSLQKQISLRSEAEKRLDQVKQNLELTVIQRTRELEQANLNLMAENSERKKAEDKLKIMAQYDDLTGLANRVLFRDHLNMSLARAHRNNELLGLLFIDLDKFKEVNDSLGHDIGDALLVEVASIFNENIREGDTAARLGGDEFALIVTDVVDSDHLADLALRFLEQLTRAFKIQGHHIEISCSIGIALFPDDSDQPDLLLKHADIAMYQAKKQGGNSFQFFFPAMQETAEKHKGVLRTLREAIADDQFQLHYQPKLDISSGTIVGVEALVRWNHPQLGLVGPDEFIPIAEKNGLINAIGEYVLGEACRQNSEWQRLGFTPIRMAVNFSPMQLRNEGIVEYVEQALEKNGMDPEWLEIELTETAVMHDQDDNSGTIRRLQALGISISIDDFGMGYSSFNRLKHLSFDVIKIDRSFISGIGSACDEAVVRAMIGMAHTLSVKLLGEGVETAEQLDFLRREGCDQYQGYYFSRPIPADDFSRLLSRQMHLASKSAH
jgi:diguanylate cyclase (GGDEF)-like protein